MANDLSIVKHVVAELVTQSCKDELSSVQHLTGKVLQRLHGIADDPEFEDRPIGDLYFFTKTLQTAGMVTKMLYDIDKDRMAPKKDALGDILGEVLGDE